MNQAVNCGLLAVSANAVVMVTGQTIAAVVGSVGDGMGWAVFWVNCSINTKR